MGGRLGAADAASELCTESYIVHPPETSITAPLM
jgi:hypothetical protein